MLAWWIDHSIDALKKLVKIDATLVAECIVAIMEHIRVGLLVDIFVEFLECCADLGALDECIQTTGSVGGPNTHKHLNGRSSLQARGLKTDKPTDVMYCRNWAEVMLLSQAFDTSTRACNCKVSSCFNSGTELGLKAGGALGGASIGLLSTVEDSSDEEAVA